MLMVLGEDEVEIKSHRVDQWDNLVTAELTNQH